MEEGEVDEVDAGHDKPDDGHHGADKGGKHKSDKSGGDSKHKANKHGGSDDKLTEGEAKLMAGLARKLLGDCQEMGR